MGCKYCTDEDGICMYPSYGVAPHRHDLKRTGSIIGSTVLLPKNKWPDNFVEDKDCPGLGTYTYCPECGEKGQNDSS